MKKILLVVLLLCSTVSAAVWVSPEFAGSGADDSVVVSFCTFDTTFYPTITDADSVIALRFGPDNALLDSITQSAANVHNPRDGWYQIHYRASDGSASVGLYQVYLRAKIGGDWRGAGSASYQVIDDAIGDYFNRLAADTDSLKDTLSILLHASDPVAVDSEEIARAVWDDDIIDRNLRRIGYADTVDVVNNVPSTGSGAYACTLYAFDSGELSAVQGVFLRAMNSGETATAAIGVTNPDGRLVLSLDAADYHIYPYLAGYQFAVLPETVTVSSSGASDTLWMSAFDPGSAPSASLCRVYGYIQTLGADELESVIVTARVLTAPLIHQGVVISPYSLSTTSDSSGYWYLDLIPNADLSPSGTEYDFSIYDASGTVLRRQMAVPDSTSFWFKW